MAWQLYEGDCLEVMRTLPDNSINLILTDPPYYRVKAEAWDRQWDNPAAFLDWIGQLCEQWRRILKPNGSLYVFASPKMAARVECKVGEWFEVLNRIRWIKKAGWHNKTKKEELRSFLSPWEEIIFAEHYGADNIAKGEAGYQAKCDDLRGFIFEPIRAYLATERDKAGFTTRQVAEAFQKKTGSRTVTGMAGHWFGRVQWMLPTADNYQWLRQLFNRNGGDYLRREYEELRREYEELRRPFAVTSDMPYTDVWDFPTVAYYPGKHPCEKPQALLRHIINASSRPGDVILDCFAGSGATLAAAEHLGRDSIGIEINAAYCAIIRERMSKAQQPLLVNA